MALLVHLKSAWELASGLGSALGKMSALEAKQAILDLQNLLGQIQGEAFELQHQNEALRGKIKELEERDETRKQMFFAGNVCWKQLDDGTREGPYCPACYELKGDLLHLITTAAAGLYDCKVCKNRFETSQHSPSIPVLRRRRPTGFMPR